MHARSSISTGSDALAKLLLVDAAEDEDGFRARGEQALGEFAQALLDSQVLENALSAAFGAREKALEAQQAAMAALNIASASDLERLERRLRSLSQRFDAVEDQIDGIAHDVAEIRRQLTASPGKARRSSNQD
jgi:septal ring factor EnvC (AmiA/AmiB activator)